MSLGLAVALAATVTGPRPLSGSTPYFAPPHSYQTIDTDSDGDYDDFRVNARVTLASASPVIVYLRAFIDYVLTTDHPSDPNLTGLDVRIGPIIDQVVTIQPGTASYAITKDARPFYLSGVVGTWTVFLYMSDYQTGEVYSTDQFTTSILSWSNFDRTEAEFTGSFSDYAQDLDGDGKKDVLRVNTSFNIVVAGTYGINGFLYKNDWSQMFSNLTIGPSYYALGMQTVPLNFDVTCCQSFIGPFRVMVRLNEAGAASSWTLYDKESYTTSTTSLGG